ncbi:MAG: response regulator [Proteobacteria bacterium]|nr:response regulator [Pseudomonadota bacterium]
MFTLFSFFPLKTVTICLVLLGAVFLFVSIVVSLDVLGRVPPRFALRWRILTFLIGFFFICYLGFVGIRFSDFPFPLELLTAIVFFAGSLFVYGTIDLSRDTIAQLHEVNENLEKIVEGRTAELSEANCKLEKSINKYAKQSQFLENALDALSHPFYVVDAENYEVILYNKASGFAGRSVFTCHQLTHGCDLPCGGLDHPCPLSEIKKTGKPAVLEHVHRDVAGNCRFVEIHSYPIFDEDGKLIHMIEYVLDITDRRLAERDLVKAKQEAEVANTFKSEFLANMSHEIRTPMNAIFGMTELALTGALTSEQRYCLETVQSSSELLLTLINDILDLSKIEAGKLELVKRPFKVERVFNEVIGLLQPGAKEKGITLAVDSSEECEAAVYLGDDLRLRQILFNLIGNSIKFTTEGSVNIGCRLREKTAQDALLEFTVADTGMGIPEEFRDRLFASFSQVNNKMTKNHGGSGLGLAISKKLVEMMDGAIRVDSSPGMGSTFTFTARFALGEDITFPGETIDESHGSDLPPLHILVVDDITPNRDLVRLILQSVNHLVDEAETGLAALHLLATKEYDAVLLDVQMPVLDGEQTVTIVRQCEKGLSPEGVGIDEDLLAKLLERLVGRHTPVIALTAHAMDSDRERLLRAGMDGYISKPFHVAEVLRQLAEIYKSMH